jgi:nitroreductase
MNPIIDLIRSHRSIRKFSGRAVDDETLKTIIEAAQCAATSHFVQAYTVIHVKDPRNRHVPGLAGPRPTPQTPFAGGGRPVHRPLSQCP